MQVKKMHLQFPILNKGIQKEMDQIEQQLVS